MIRVVEHNENRLWVSESNVLHFGYYFATLILFSVGIILMLPIRSEVDTICHQHACIITRSFYWGPWKRSTTSTLSRTKIQYAFINYGPISGLNVLHSPTNEESDEFSSTSICSGYFFGYEKIKYLKIKDYLNGLSLDEIDENMQDAGKYWLISDLGESERHQRDLILFNRLFFNETIRIVRHNDKYESNYLLSVIFAFLCFATSLFLSYLIITILFKPTQHFIFDKRIKKCVILNDKRIKIDDLDFEEVVLDCEPNFRSLHLTKGAKKHVLKNFISPSKQMYNLKNTILNYIK